MSFSDWDLLQARAFQLLWDRIDNGPKCLAVTAPTGFGKTKLSRMSIAECQRRNWPWVFYTHRKTLFSQTHETFLQDGIDHGCRASGWREREALLKDGQLAMLPSERAAKAGERRDFHDARLVIIDEAHCNKKGFAKEAIDHHLSQGATVVLLTATPVGLGGSAREMVALCKTSELRKVGGIVEAECYSPNTVDLSKVKKVTTAIPGAEKQAKLFLGQQVVGSIITHFQNLNPTHAPSIGFAPDVSSSMGMVDEFRKWGIRAAHIDGKNIYYGEKNGQGVPELIRSTQTNRDKLFAESKSGEITILWNRFVMREGVDCPWLAHCVMACAFGSPEAWIQSCGRVVRAYPGLSKVVIQDHGGNFYREGLGSPNADRLWLLGDTNQSIVKRAKEERAKGEEKPSVSCPGCHREISRAVWQKNGSKCPLCGSQFKTSHRKVFQTDGTLKKVRDKSLVKSVVNEAQKAWDSMFFRTRQSQSDKALNFNQLKAWFERETGYSVVTHHQNGEVTTMARNSEGEKQPLGRVPEPASPLWSEAVRDVRYSDLQNIQKKRLDS